MAKILVVEDDKDVAAAIRTYLLFEKHTFELITVGAEALAHLKTFPYDLHLQELREGKARLEL